MKDIKEKNAFVTGSSRGVGQQIALGLAKMGCNVILHGRTIDSTKSTLNLLKQYNINTYQVSGNLSDFQEVRNIIQEVKQMHIGVDILYNNAAIMTSYRYNIWEHSWNDWLESYKVNVIAMYNMCGEFIPDMIKNGYGRVVNLTSRINEQPELAPYGASKWAVDKLTHDIASKLKNTGVRINTLDPGWLKTDMGGANAEHPVEAVLPGALAPVLIDNDGPNGQFFSAQEHRNLAY